MPWWGWVVAGALLLGAELALVDAEFYFVFLGLAALLTGAAVFAAPSAPFWLPWLLFAVLAVLSMVLFRAKLYTKLRGQGVGFGDGIVGEMAVATEAIAPGTTGRGELRGAVWTLRNVGRSSISPGDLARVEATHGLTLDVVAPER